MADLTSMVQAERASLFIVGSTRRPPGPAHVALGEISVHGEDVLSMVGRQKALDDCAGPGVEIMRAC